MRRSKTIFGVLVFVCCLRSAFANEALDLLEGKITAEEVTVTKLLEEKKEAERPLEETREEDEVLRDDRDYSDRWKNRLYPLALVYENERNQAVQRVAIDGLAEWGIVAGEIDADDSGADEDVNDSQIRRIRLGGLVRAFYNTDLEGRVIADGDGVQGIDALKATVQVNEATQLEVGKFRPPFSQEYRQDPSVRVAPGLSPIVEQIAPANSLGVRVEVNNGPWDLGLGWFSDGLDEYLPEISGGGFILANLAYTFDGEVIAEAGDEDVVVPPGHQRWHLDYIYNTSPGLNGAIPRAYRHLVSTGIEVSTGEVDFAGDFLFANGDEDSVWGLTLTSRYWLLENALRLVGRYNYADTDDEAGLSVGFGVPGAVGDSTQPLLGFSNILPADELHSFYLGLDWHILQDYLLITTGLELQLLSDEINGDSSALLWHTGGRAAF